MTTPAVTIQNAIDFCADNIADLSFDAVVSVHTRMTTWLGAMFGTSGIFPPGTVERDPAGNRMVSDWYGYSNHALASLDGAGVGQGGILGTNNLIDAVSRTLCAVRDARAGNHIEASQQTSTIAAFNTAWT